MKRIVLCECRLNSMGKREIASFWIDTKGGFCYEANRGKNNFVTALVARWRKEGIIGMEGKCYMPEDGEMFLDALEIKYNGIFLQAFSEGTD